MAAFVLTPWLMTAGIGLLYYRRIRRQFGRQTYRPKRTVVRIAFLGAVACGVAVAAVALPHIAIAVACGALAGAALGWLAQRHMHVEWRDGLRSYTPNPWIGGALSVLLVARLAWRWHAGGFAFGAAADSQQVSPLTFAVLATLLAYYLVSGIGLMLRMRALPAASGESIPFQRTPDS